MVPPQVRPATTYPAIVGAVLLNLRERHGLQQSEVAEALGLSPSTWSRVERGALAVSLEQLAAAAEYFETSPGQVLQEADSAVTRLRKQGVHVEPGRPPELIPKGLVFLGVAALIGLLALGARKR